MLDGLAGRGKRGVRAARRLAYQIGVSTVATLVGALVTSLYFKSEAPVPPPPASPPTLVLSIDPASVAGLIGGSFTPAGLRLRPAYPVEFAAFPVSTLSSEWKTPLAAPEPERSQSSRARSAPSTASAGCLRDCDRRAVAQAEAILPPPRPASLTTVATSETAARSALAAPGEAGLLGLPLPRWTASGEAIVDGVVSWGKALRDLID